MTSPNTDHSKNEYFQTSDASDLLALIFQKKKDFNSSFSLRQFAKKLRISPSNISEILSKKYGISLILGKKIAENLEVDVDISRYFLQLVELKHETDEERRNKLRQAIYESRYEKKIYEMEEHRYECISNWHHMVIFEYIKNLGKISFNEVDKVAKTFGISEIAVIHSISTLKKLGLLQKEKSVFKPSMKYADICSTGEAVQKSHQQFLDLAKKSFKEQSPLKRKFTCSILSVREEDYKKVFDIISELHQRLHLEVDKVGKGSKVGSFITGFFQLEKDSD